MFAKKFRQHGPTHLSQYFIPVKVGDYVDIFANPAIHKGEFLQQRDWGNPCPLMTTSCFLFVSHLLLCPHPGMPHKHYHGRTGIVFNVTKSAVGVRVNKLVNGRILEKRIHVRIEHIRKSKCQKEIIERVKSNEAAKKAAREGGEKVVLKRLPKAPKEGYFLAAPGGDGEITTIQPLPFSDLV